MLSDIVGIVAENLASWDLRCPAWLIVFYAREFWNKSIVLIEKTVGERTLSISIKAKAEKHGIKCRDRASWRLQKILRTVFGMLNCSF
jgi:hypothetical protein